MRGLRGSLQATFEEGTCAAWLHDLLKPHVSHLVVCDPRKNNLAKVGNKNDRNDARELAELLYRNKLEPVYHGEHGIRTSLRDLMFLLFIWPRLNVLRGIGLPGGNIESHPALKALCAERQCLSIGNSLYTRAEGTGRKHRGKLFAIRLPLDTNEMT